MEFPNRIIVEANELMVHSQRKRPLKMHFLYKTLTNINKLLTNITKY